MYIKRHRINATVTATGGGAQSFYTPTVNGYIEAFRYLRGTTGTTASGVSTGAKYVLTAEQSGLAILTIATASDDSKTYYPRAYAQDTSGAALGMTSAASPPGIPTYIPVAQERIKITVTSGGVASNGGVRAVLDLYIQGGG